MKKIILTLFLTLTYSFGFAQQSKIDSLRNALHTATHDSIRIKLIRRFTAYYVVSNYDSLLFYASKGLSIARKSKQSLHEGDCLTLQASALTQKGEYTAALKNLLQAFDIFQNPASEKNVYGLGKENPFKFRLDKLCFTHQIYGDLMEETGNIEQAIFHYKESYRLTSLTKNYYRISLASAKIAQQYYELDQFDSVEVYAQKSLKFFDQMANYRWKSLPMLLLANKNLKEKNDEFGRKYLYKALQLATEYKEENKQMLVWIHRTLSSVHQNGGGKDSSLYYAKKAYEVASEPGLINTQYFRDGGVYEGLYKAYLLNNQPDSVLKYQGLTLATKDAWNKEKYKNLAAFQSVLLSEATRLRELEKQRIETQSKIRTYGLLAVLAFLFIIGFFLYRNNRQKQKANIVLQGKNEEINLQKNKVEKALTELKSTQAQLIQSEKLASLGELTAGIAHEIQNPLNFVNNFSELSNELIKEMKEEFKKGDTEEGFAIADDIEQNLEKINHHGKRASDIVKGMLEHSRTSTGQKELTDINALCNDYLRLAYQGQKAKNKDFNATMETHFDPNLPKMEVIPQDIGRVILNLINNAFYAVNERSKDIVRAAYPSGVGGKGGQVQEPNYLPTVSITTQLTANSQLLIAVKDNGSGIPQDIKDKIFQPFFTTKPTGQGTGLGLSLSYDIVKAHGGELKVETLPADLSAGNDVKAEAAAQAGKENEDQPGKEAGSTFIISIPAN
jgi:two-component system, NtrC family, sensor kinase